MKMIDMAVSEDEKKCCGPMEKSEGPEYPYCLKIYLGPDELKKLGVNPLPPLGAMLDLMAKVKVVGQRLDDDKSTMEIQICEMVLGKPQQKTDHESVLYTNLPGMGGSTQGA